jgi:hypothetical protein
MSTEAALAVLADATEYWEFGGKQAAELSNVDRCADGDKEVLKRLSKPRIKQLEGWLATKRRRWPPGFVLPMYSEANFRDKEDWLQQVRYVSRKRVQYVQTMLESIAVLKEAFP